VLLIPDLQDMKKMQREINREARRIDQVQSHDHVIVLHLIHPIEVSFPPINNRPQPDEIAEQSKPLGSAKIEPKQRNHASSRQCNTYQREPKRFSDAEPEGERLIAFRGIALKLIELREWI